VRDAAADAAIDAKHGAKKAAVRTEATATETKEKGRSWLARLFGRGKVGEVMLTMPMSISGYSNAGTQSCTRQAAVVDYCLLLHNQVLIMPHVFV
jgi:hypothetical protein